MCLQNQNQAGDSSKYHHCRHCLLLWIPDVDHNLFSKLLSQRLLRCPSGGYCVLGPPSSPLLTTRSTTMDTPEDEAAAARVPPDCRASSISSQGVPLVLQVSCLPGSYEPNKFSMTHSPNLSPEILRVHMRSSSITVTLSTTAAPTPLHFRTSVPQQSLATFPCFLRASLLRAVASSSPSSPHFFVPLLPKQWFQRKLLPPYCLLAPSSIFM
jgi:hypothetical protein